MSHFWTPLSDPPPGPPIPLGLYARPPDPSFLGLFWGRGFGERLGDEIGRDLDEIWWFGAGSPRGPVTQNLV